MKICTLLTEKAKLLEWKFSMELHFALENHQLRKPAAILILRKQNMSIPVLEVTERSEYLLSDLQLLNDQLI